MSRVGKEPIVLPKGIEASVVDGVLTVKSSKDTKTLDTLSRVNIEVAEGKIVFGLKGETKQDRAFWGTYRAVANNIVVGVFVESSINATGCMAIPALLSCWTTSRPWAINIPPRQL